MGDEKKKAKADKLAQKGSIDEAVRMYLEADYPLWGAELLKNNGRAKEAAAIYQENGDDFWATKCLLDKGLEDHALSVRLPSKYWPKNYSELDEQTRERIAKPCSKLWSDYIQELDGKGERLRALTCLLKAQGLLLDSDWDGLVTYFSDKAQSKEELEVWAEVALADKSFDRVAFEQYRGHGPQVWEAALAYFKAGDNEKALEIFHRRIFYMDVQTKGCPYRWAGMSEARPAVMPEEMFSFLEFIAGRCLSPGTEVSDELVFQLAHFVFFKADKTYELWPKLPADLQRDMIGRLLAYRGQFYKIPEEWNSIQRELNLQVAGIGIAWDLYNKLGRQATDVEEKIISHAYELERYDYVLYSLERFGRLEEALQVLDEIPAHLIWPVDYQSGNELPKQKAQEWYRDKLQLKLRRAGKGRARPALTKEDLDRMLALGEITKEEFDKLRQASEGDE